MASGGQPPGNEKESSLITLLGCLLSLAHLALQEEPFQAQALFPQGLGGSKKGSEVFEAVKDVAN